jgi:hypothetical protein
MKKFAIVASLVALSSLGLVGCSSTPELAANDSTTDMPVEAAAQTPAFDALANSNGGAEPQNTGAVIDTANPATTVADNSAYTPPVDTAPAKSPVNLGASSAGRAH